MNRLILAGALAVLVFVPTTVIKASVCFDCSPPIYGHAVRSTVQAAEDAAIADCESMCNSNFCGFHASLGGQCDGATVPAENASCSISHGEAVEGGWHADATGDCWCTNPGGWEPMAMSFRVVLEKLGFKKPTKKTVIENPYFYYDKAHEKK